MANTANQTCPAALENALEYLHRAAEGEPAPEHLTVALATMKGYTELAARAPFPGLAQKYRDRRTEAMYLGRTIKRRLGQ